MLDSTSSQPHVARFPLVAPWRYRTILAGECNALDARKLSVRADERPSYGTHIPPPPPLVYSNTQYTQHTLHRSVAS